MLRSGRTQCNDRFMHNRCTLAPLTLDYDRNIEDLLKNGLRTFECRMATDGVCFRVQRQLRFLQRYVMITLDDHDYDYQ